MVVFLSIAIMLIGVVGGLNAPKIARVLNQVQGTNFKPKVNLLAMFGGIIVGGGLFATTMFTVIPANTVGIHYSPFSGVKEEVLQEGLQIKGPFDIVYEISTQVQTVTLYDVTSQTKDSQFLTSDVEIKYQVNKERAFEVFKRFKTLDGVTETLIPAVAQKDIESVTTQYNVIEILGEFRNDVYIKVEEVLEDTLAESGVDLFSMTFIDTDAGAAIEQAIQEEAVAKKAVETAEQERLKAEIDAQIRVVEAQADLDKAKIEAESVLIAAQAQADANKLISSSITQALIDYELAEARKVHGWYEINTNGSVDLLVGK